MALCQDGTGSDCMAAIPVSARDSIPSLLGTTHARRGALREKCRSGPCALPDGELPWQS